MSDDLGDRVTKFCLLELPGQPRMMHMGTSHLVSNLWHEVVRLRSRLEELCPGHVASADDPRVCAHCGVHIDSLRPPEDDV